jgi:hypothetical protein
MQRTLFALAFVSAVSAAHAGVIVVAPTGIPSTIQGAVDVASDGDVILVESGIYPSFVIRNKELTIVADTGADVKIDGAIRVGNLASTRTVVLSGLESLGSPAAKRWGLRVVNCSGLVFVQDCVLMGAPSSSGAAFAERASLLVTDSAGVVLSHCVVAGSVPQQDPLDDGYAGPAFDGARITNSNVSLYQSKVLGGRAGAGEVNGMRGGDALVAIGARVFASDCAFVGGDASDGGYDGNGGDGGHGAVVQAESVFTTVDVTFAGGAAGSAGACASPFACPHAGVAGAPSSVESGATMTALSGPARTFTAPALVREHGNATLAFQGAPDDTLARASSWRGSARFSVERGAQVPARHVTFRAPTVGVLDAAGVFAQTLPILELGQGIESRVLFFQGVHVASDASLRFGTPRALIQLDSAP